MPMLSMAWIWFKGYRVMEKQETTYILRPDTVVELPDTENTYNRFVRIYDRLGQYITDLDLEAFNRGFVEFDEDATRKQIADIITFYRTLVNGWAETGAGADDLPETALEESIDAILDVTLGRKQ